MVDTSSVIALVAVSAQLALLVALHVLPTKYDPVRDAISDYGVGDYRGWFWAQLVAGALACTSVAIALTGLHPYVPTVVVVLLFANAAARLLMPAFPTDQPGSRFETVKGKIHMVLAVVAFASVAAAATATRSRQALRPKVHGNNGTTSKHTRHNDQGDRGAGEQDRNWAAPIQGIMAQWTGGPGTPPWGSPTHGGVRVRGPAPLRRQKPISA
jgi:hypothetical protein